MTAEPPTHDDVRVIQQQINAKAVNPYAIIVRCAYTFPMLIVQKINSAGSLQFQHLANPIWLTCPYLNEKIHILETDGYIQKIKQYMDDDRIMTMHMHDAHAEFYYLRKRLYHRQFNTPYPEKLTPHFNLGIGGIQDIRQLKCLHLHFAHYLICKKNKVGYMTKLLLNNKIYCDDGRCTCLRN